MKKKQFVEPQNELDLLDSNEQCCNKVEQIDGLIKIGEHGLIKVEVEPDIAESMMPVKKKRIRIRNQKGIDVEPKVCPICAKL